MDKIPYSQPPCWPSHNKLLPKTVREAHGRYTLRFSTYLSHPRISKTLELLKTSLSSSPRLAYIPHGRHQQAFLSATARK